MSVDLTHVNRSADGSSWKLWEVLSWGTLSSCLHPFAILLIHLLGAA